ncbi:MAG: hypothetical protein ACKVTZ_17000 [Bacteroidia bacterium]
MERIVFVDTSFSFEQVIETRNFPIQHHRFVSILSQIPLLTAVALGCSLKSLMLIYSVTFILLYSIYYFLIDKIIRNQRLLMLPIFILLLMCAHSFYWIVSEFQQGLMLMTVFLAAWDKKSNELTASNTSFQIWEKSTFYLLFALVILFAHPLMVFILLYSVLFLFLDSQHKTNPYLIAMSLLFLGLCYVKHKYHVTEYDSVARANAFNSIQEHLQKGDFWQLKSTQQFLAQLKGDYLLFPIVFLANCIFYIWKKQPLKIVLMLGAVIGYILLVTLSFPQGADKFYFDNQYLTLCFFVSLPFVMDIIHTWANQKILITIICFIVLGRLGYVINEQKVFRKRLDYIESLLTKADKLGTSDRYLVSDFDPHLMKELLQPWTLGYETVILTALHQTHKTRQIMTVPEIEKYSYLLKEKSNLAFRWSQPNPQKIERYFLTIDTSKTYQILPDSIR